MGEVELLLPGVSVTTCVPRLAPSLLKVAVPWMYSRETGHLWFFGDFTVSAFSSKWIVFERHR